MRPRHAILVACSIVSALASLSCRMLPPRADTTEARIRRALTTTVIGRIDCRDAYVHDAIGFVDDRVASATAGYPLNLMLVGLRCPGGGRGVVYQATHEPAASVLAEIIRQAGLSSNVMAGALCIAPPNEMARLKALSPLVARRGSRLRTRLNRRLDLDACMDNIQDWASYVRQESGVDVDVAQAAGFPFPQWRSHIRDMTAADLLWWMAVCSDNEVSIEGNVVRFRMRLPAGPARQYGCYDGSSVNVSLIALLAAPAAYSGRVVRTVGVLDCRAGDRVMPLCLSLADMDNGIWLNSVSVVFDLDALRTDIRALRAFHRKYVWVQGMFDAGQHDREPSIRDVSWIWLYRDPAAVAENG